MRRDVIERLTRILEREDQRWRMIKDTLSGAAGVSVDVVRRDAASYLVILPVAFLQPNGLRVVEAATPDRAAILHGTTYAVAHAERRIAKLLGASWGARLTHFDPTRRTATFAVFQHAVQTS